MVTPLFGTVLWGTNLFADGLLVVFIIPIYDAKSKLVDYRVLQVLVESSKILATNISDNKIL